MAAISEAKRAANRENAKKSTGPRTPEGKERSRANALKHGLSGAGVVRAEGLEHEVQARVNEWTGALKPQTGPERWLVERAAVDSVRVDGAVRSERGRHASRLRKHALDPGDGERADFRAARLGETLLSSDADPRPLRLRLRSTSAGCSWLIEQWEGIARRQETLGRWSESDFARAERLLGGSGGRGTLSRRFAEMAAGYIAQTNGGWMHVPDPLRPGTVPTHAPLLNRLTLSGWSLKDFLAPEDRSGDAATTARALDRLRTFVAEEIAELAQRRDRLAEIEALDASEAADRLQVDLSPEGLLLHRYELELDRRVRRSLRELDRLKRERATETDTAPVPALEASPAPIPRNEPTAAPKPLAAKELPPSPPLLPSPFRLDGPDTVPPLPIHMVPVSRTRPALK